MEENKLFLAFPYVLLIGLIYSMVQSSYEGIAVFLFITTALICALITWLLLRPVSKEAAQGQTAFAVSAPQSAGAIVPPSRPAEAAKPVRRPDPPPSAPAEAAGDSGFIIQDDVLVFYYGQESVVHVPKGVRSIGNGAFLSRPSPKVLPSIPAQYRAQYDESLLDKIAPLVKDQVPGNPYIKRVILPRGVTHIQHRAFYMCANLTAVEIPDTLQFIGASAFCHCAKLTEISLPKDVHLTLSPFYGCSKEVYQILQQWEQAKKPPAPPPQKPVIPIAPQGGLTLQNAVFDIKDGVLLHYKGHESHVIIPEGVHTIGKQAFVKKSTHTYTTSVPPMFWDQYGADSFTGQAEVTTTTYDGMPFIRRVTLPKGLHTIGEEAFLKCGGLQEINFPSSLQLIMYRAFFQCRRLKAMDLPRHVQLEMSAFEDCSDEIILAAYRHRERSGKPLTIRGHAVRLHSLNPSKPSDK